MSATNHILMRKCLFFTVFAAFVWLGCKKSSTPPSTPILPITPTISALSPDSGAFNTVVTIAGTNFNPTAAMNSVSFNGVSATVSSASATQLSVIVPKGSGTGPVKVTVGALTATGPVFNYVYTYNVSTLAGGTIGYLDGTGAAAKFNDPFGIAVDTNGNIIVADAANNRIRMVTPAGVVTTVAGSLSKDVDGPVSTASFLLPVGVAIDSMNNIIVSDEGYRIREISTSGIVSTIAGSTQGHADGPVATALFDEPFALTIDGTGKIYVCDAHFVRVVGGGNVSTLYDGLSYSSTFGSFISITLGQNNNLYTLNFDGSDVFNLTIAGVLSVFAGSGVGGFQDGQGTSAYFSTMRGVCVDANGNILVADQSNQRIRLITPSGLVSTIAGGNTAGEVDGPAAAAQFFNPQCVTVDKRTGVIYVLESMSNRIRKITVE